VLNCELQSLSESLTSNFGDLSHKTVSSIHHHHHHLCNLLSISSHIVERQAKESFFQKMAKTKQDHVLIVGAGTVCYHEHGDSTHG
jgi:hypothetical protein